MLISGCDSPVPLVRGKQQGTPPSYHLCREGSRGLPILWPQKAQPGVETMLLTSQVLFSGSFPFEFRSQERLWRETLPHPFCFFTALDWILTSYPGHLPLRGWWPFQAPAPLESSLRLAQSGKSCVCPRRGHSALPGGRCVVFVGPSGMVVGLVPGPTGFLEFAGPITPRGFAGWYTVGTVLLAGPAVTGISISYPSDLKTGNSRGFFF